MNILLEPLHDGLHWQFRTLLPSVCSSWRCPRAPRAVSTRTTPACTYGEAAGCLPSALRCQRRPLDWHLDSRTHALRGRRHSCRPRAPQRRRVLHSRTQFSAVYLLYFRALRLETTELLGVITAPLLSCGQTRSRALMASRYRRGADNALYPSVKRYCCNTAPRALSDYLRHFSLIMHLILKSFGDPSAVHGFRNP